MSVLVVTQPDDLTSDMVIREMAGRNVKVHRINPDDLGRGLEVAGSVLDGQLVIADEYRTTRLEDVRSIYWRRPRRATPSGEPDASTAALAGMLRLADKVVWMNHPGRNDEAWHKPMQLRVARECGLDVPPTVVTNQPEAASSFLDVYPEAVVKRLVQPHEGLVPTQPLNRGDDLGRIAECTQIVQSRVDKRADIRLTMVADRPFAARITPPDGVLDWRTCEDACNWEPVGVPRPIEKGIARFMRHYGLVYGAFDFALARSGPWVFLECNPNGQFGFVEKLTGMVISRAIADLLIQGPDGLMQAESLAGGHRQSSPAR